MRRYQAMALDAGLHGTPLFSTFLEVICVVFRPWYWTRDCMAPR